MGRSEKPDKQVKRGGGESHRTARVEKEIRDVVGLLFNDTLTDPFVIYLKVCEIVFMRDFLAEPERLKASLEQIGLFARVGDLYNAVV